jgi:hypothetical protein
MRPVGSFPRKRARVDVDDDLVALARGARIEVVMEGALDEQRQRVRLLLLLHAAASPTESCQV